MLGPWTCIKLDVYKNDQKSHDHRQNHAESEFLQVKKFEGLHLDEHMWICEIPGQNCEQIIHIFSQVVQTLYTNFKLTKIVGTTSMKHRKVGF